VKVCTIYIQIARCANISLESSRFNNIPLKDIKGEIYGLCKDQHGCRYLQKKLEERNAKDIQMIFEEIKDHMADLMIGEWLENSLSRALS